MGMTLAEKILAEKSGLSAVTPGQIVDAYPDLVMSHTATWRSVSVMEKVGATQALRSGPHRRRAGPHCSGKI